MNYFKMKLKSEKMAYAIREYFPYTDKPFFKCLDDILADEELQTSLAHLFVQLYNDELVFLFEEINKHEYIIPIKHASEKFTKINEILCSKIVSILGVKLIDDYFDLLEIPRVDIRDEYTKEKHNINIKVNDKYKDIPVIIFDCCCSTGSVFNRISESVPNNNNLYLCYGIRFNSHTLNNSNILELNEYDFDVDGFNDKKPGYFVRIYGLFGDKNVEVDFRDDFSIVIGENGFGKSTATRLALLALKSLEIRQKDVSWIFEDDKEEPINVINQLARFYFDKIKIYYSDYFVNLNLIDGSGKKYEIKKGNRVYSLKFGKGLVIAAESTSCHVQFDDVNVGIKHMSKSYLSLLNDKGEILKDEYKVSFVDENNYCFHEQLVEAGGCINIDELKRFNLHQNEYLLSYKSINCDTTIKVKKFKFDDVFEYLKSYESSLVSEIKYIDVIPNRYKIISECNDDNINEFLKIINDVEYSSIIRKIILNDRSIEIDYKSIEMKYHKEFDFISIDRMIRCMIDELHIQKEYDLICVNENLLNDLEQNKISLLNCTKSRKILPPPSRDRIKLDYYEDEEDYFEDYYKEDYEVDFDTDVYEDYNNYIDEEIEEKSYYKDLEREETYKIDDPFAFDYDDPEDYNPYEDDDDYYEDMDGPDDDWEPYIDDEMIEKYEEKSYVDRLVSSASKNFGCSLTDIEKIEETICSNVYNLYLSKFWDLSKLHYSNVNKCSFDSATIKLRNILNNTIFRNETNSNFYSILNQIFEYNNLDLEKNDLFKFEIFGKKDSSLVNKHFNYKTNLNVSIAKFLTEKNVEEINSVYNYVFGEAYNFIGFGVYDVLKNEDFILLNSIIKRLRSNGIVTKKDYLIVLGLKILIDSYKLSFISKSHILLEKLINKYLINKKARVYANTIVITDLNNNFVPIDCLSTGERNLIILFTFCLTNVDSLIVLDEPDLSMSVAWQSKVLIDLLKYTSNKYMIVSQSPLLVQNNNLSSFVKRMEFDAEVTDVELSKLVAIIKKFGRRSFAKINDDLWF